VAPGGFDVPRVDPGHALRDGDKSREQLLEELRLLRRQLGLGDERRQRAETALREAREFLARLLDHTPAPIYLTGRDGRRRLVNRAWEELWRQPRAEVIGRTVEELYPPALARQFLEENRRVLETEAPLAFEEEIDTPGGRRDLYTVKFPLYDAAGQVEAAGGISFDITERQRAEGQLHAYSERVQALSRRLLIVQEEERRNLARELHDGVCQVLTCLAFALDGAPETATRLG
jgi:PAS domain S-box-containing protein